MKLKKEFFLVICILIFVFALEIITNYITKENINKICTDVKCIIDDIEKIKNIPKEELNSKFEIIRDRISALKNTWLEKEKKLSVFCEHSEIDNVSKSIIILEENYKNMQFSKSLENCIEVLYWLDYIEDRDKLDLKNIF